MIRQFERRCPLWSVEFKLETFELNIYDLSLANCNYPIYNHKLEYLNVYDFSFVNYDDFEWNFLRLHILKSKSCYKFFI